MSTTSSDSEEDSIPDDDSEYNYYPGKYTIIETEIMQASDNDGESEQASAVEIGPYSNEPLADEEWQEAYKIRQDEKERRRESLKDRLAGKESLDEWCSCGNCSTTFLENENECVCCKDFERCVECLSDEWVLQDMGTAPECVTLHPAFSTVCLDRWSLRLAASKYRTIDKKSYQQTGSEDAFMRSVAYRQFINLVYDRVGKMRIPLPACAYHAIRSTFQPKEGEQFVGYQDDDDVDD